MTQEAAVPAGYLDQVRRIAREEVAAAYRSGSLRNAAITGGGLTVKGGFLRVLFPESEGGGVGVFFGDVVQAETGDYLGTGLLVQDPDGQDIAQFRSDVASGVPVSALFDGAGDTAMSTDRTSGFGLARPYLSSPFIPSRFADMSLATSSGSFETLAVSYGYRTHAAVLGWTRACASAAGVTGEIQVLVNGVALEAPTAVGFAVTTSFHGPAVPAGDLYDFLTVEIQGRVTGGAGQLLVAGGGWISRPL